MPVDVVPGLVLALTTVFRPDSDYEAHFEVDLGGRRLTVRKHGKTVSIDGVDLILNPDGAERLAAALWVHCAVSLGFGDSHSLGSMRHLAEVAQVVGDEFLVLVDEESRGA